MVLSFLRIATIVVLLAGLLLPSAGFAAEATQKIRIAYASRSSSALPQYVALQKGFFKEQGLDVEIIQMNPRLGAPAVVSGEVAFATPFTSTFRGALQGLPIKLVFVHIKKGPYFLIVRPEIKDVQQLRGKKLGVATIKGTDQLVAEEMLQAKGFNIGQIQAVAIGDGPVRMQALVSGAVEAVCLAPPHDLMLRKMGYNALLGPPEVGLPSAGMLTSDKLVKENPQLIRRTLRALLRSHQHILENRQDSIATLLKWLPQPLDIAEHSYDAELKNGLNRDGTMTDAEINAIIERVGEKKRPLDEVRDFSFAREALKELGLK
ncbi:MAG: ABC transporter substrate-binding protein [Deltaproteobacteria bacterium]|nr:ABC transporter substrate-binding protein [Deltaproteobacteria bacterium]